MRVSSSVHIPSDLKEVLFNVDAHFDVLDIPKPIFFKITDPKPKSPKDETVKDDNTKVTDSKKSDSSIESNEKKDEEKESSKEETKETVADSDSGEKENMQENESNDDKDKSENTEKDKSESDEPTKEEQSRSTVTEQCDEVDMDIDDESTATDTVTSLIETNVPLDAVVGAKIDVADGNTEFQKSVSQENKIEHKFNVKVLLFALPTLSNIYEKIFGEDFDARDSKYDWKNNYACS